MVEEEETEVNSSIAQQPCQRLESTSSAAEPR